MTFLPVLVLSGGFVLVGVMLTVLSDYRSVGAAVVASELSLAAGIAGLLYAGCVLR